MRIGVVDVDTSHPQNWIPIERELGHEVVGLWDGGSVHPASYVEQFAKKHEIPQVYASLEEMAADVDCVIIHGCDWDTHIDKARPFVEAGKSVFVDKPQAGNRRDLDQLRRWAGDGTRITGGSSLMFCKEVREFLSQPEKDRGVPHTVFGGCGVDDFNYGIHAYALVSGVFGPGVVSVRHLGKHVQRRIQLTWADGRMGIVVTGATGQWAPFYASIVTDRGVEQIVPSVKILYRSMLEVILPYLAGETGAPVAMDDIIEPELCALAAQRSWLDGDREVTIEEIGKDDVSFNGRQFAKGYRENKYSSK